MEFSIHRFGRFRQIVHIGKKSHHYKKDKPETIVSGDHIGCILRAHVCFIESVLESETSRAHKYLKWGLVILHTVR